MNVSNILNEIENVDQEIYDRVDKRRNIIKNFMRFGSKFALASIPIALGSLLNKAYGKVPERILDVLNYALTLEHLEFRFYETAMNTPNLVPAIDKISIIRDHEREHVKFLQDTITQSGGTPVSEGKYDFTAKGTYPNVFSSYEQFLLVAQGFEDTGVGAYKGQASKLKRSNEILEAALRIHSVEARHAAHIRIVRLHMGYDPRIRPTIIGNDRTKGTPQAPIYKHEDKHRQVVLFNIDGIGGYKTGNAGTSSFDEPLHKEEVLKIVAPFMA